MSASVIYNVDESVFAILNLLCQTSAIFTTNTKLADYIAINE